MSKTREERVQEFLDYAGPPSFELVWACLSEEFLELNQAAMAWHEEENEETRANLVKEWADVQYTLSQLAVYYRIPGEKAFSRAADNNMTKVQDGEIRRREDGKILKPANYKPCDMKGL